MKLSAIIIDINKYDSMIEDFEIEQYLVLNKNHSCLTVSKKRINDKGENT